MTNSWRVVFRNCSLISLGKASVFSSFFIRNFLWLSRVNFSSQKLLLNLFGRVLLLLFIALSTLVS